MHMRRTTGMLIPKLCHAKAFCLGLTLFAATEAWAGGLAIWPVHVNLTSDSAIQELQISNPTNETSYVQVMAVELHQPGEVDEAPYVEEILAIPPVFELGPEDTQIVRIATRRPIQDETERSYRLVVTEVPRTAGLVPNSLSISTRMTLPIFVTPKGAVPLPIWKIEERGDKQSRLVLVNQGNAHIQIQNVEVIPAEEETIAFETAKGGVVHAGKDMTWPLEIELAALKGSVTVKAKTSIGPIETQVAVPES